MFSFFNTLDILPTGQVDFIAQTLRETGISASFLVKGKTGALGCVALNAWTNHSDPLTCTLPTEVVCCAGRRRELQRCLQEFTDLISSSARLAGTPPGGDGARPEPVAAPGHNGSDGS